MRRLPCSGPRPDTLRRMTDNPGAASGVLGVKDGVSPMVLKHRIIHGRSMEFVTDLVGGQFDSLFGPGLLAIAAAATLVLATGLGARIVEICENLITPGFNPRRNGTVAQTWPSTTSTVGSSPSGEIACPIDSAMTLSWESRPEPTLLTAPFSVSHEGVAKQRRNSNKSQADNRRQGNKSHTDRRVKFVDARPRLSLPY